MDRTIRLSGKFTVHTAETHYRKIFSSDGDINLILSANLDLRSVLSLSSCLQLIQTWATRCPAGRCVMEFNSWEDVDVLHRDEYRVGALFSAYDRIELRVGDESKPIHRDLLKQCLNLSATTSSSVWQTDLFGAGQLSGDMPMKGHRVALFSADKYGEHTHPSWFYRGHKSERIIHDGEMFAELLRASFQKCISTLSDKSARNIETKDMGELLFELIDNTHRWGRWGYQREPIGFFRCCIVDFRFAHSGTPTKPADVLREIPNFSNFANAHANLDPSVAFLELTVLDGGMGLQARQLRSRNIETPSIQDEFDAVIACLRKWGSTASDPGRGKGLHKVVQVLNNRRGMLVLRSGKLLLQRDFVNNPLQVEDEGVEEAKERIEASFADVLEEGCTREHPQTAGTAVSIIVPISQRAG